MASINPQPLNADEQAIWKVLEPFQNWKAEGVTYETVFDSANHQYQIVQSGWRGAQRLYGILVHMVIRGQYVWLETDNTELEIANRLIEAGIPKERIVLGFQAPYKRTLEGFASGQ